MSANGPSPSTAHGVYNTTPPTMADQQPGPIQLDVNGNVKVAISGSGGSGIVSTSIDKVGGVNVPATGQLPVSGATMPLSTTADTATPVTLTNATAATIATGATGTQVNIITGITVSYGALGNAVTLAIRNVGGGTAYKWSCLLPAATASPEPVYIGFPTPIASAAATALEVLCTTTPTTGSVMVSAVATIVQ